jgi:hypothetical protein
VRVLGAASTTCTRVDREPRSRHTRTTAVDRAR